MPNLAVHNKQPRVPAKIGKYEIINEIGKGTTGDVFLSHDHTYGRDVAVKLYHIDAGAETQQAKVARKMFFNEAHIVGKLQHENILPIYDAGEEDGKYYVVMEHVQGVRTLAAYCRPDNLLRVQDVIEIVFKCAKALHYAHSRGLIHRDIKPSNIMLTPDNDVRIIDFGIALLKDVDHSMIQGVAGSPSYMSPEQIKSEELTPASDLYSLAAVMYELLTGFRPFRASNLSKLLNQIVFATAPPIHTLRADISEDLEGVVAEAMQKDPSKRFKNGQAFAASLTRVYQSAQNQDRDENVDEQSHFEVLRRLNFFHDFSHGEIRELLRASEWRTYQGGEEIVREGEMDDRFYVVVAGNCVVETNGVSMGHLEPGNCFGETSYVSGAKRTATIKSEDSATVLSVSSTLLEQLSTECQLRFNKTFLRVLISRLQSPDESMFD
ncbi:MAG: protein kinase domain-containing protein [Gammaproteobacteria bacterium]